MMVAEMIVILQIILKFIYIYFKLSLLKASENEFRVITMVILFSLIFILKYSELGSN